MFEKEAEEYTVENVCSSCYFEKPCENKCEAFGCADSKTYVLKAFKDGAEFGYNKANEWHYVKDGLPKDNEYVLIYTDLNNYYVATKVENHFMSKGWGFIPMSTVIAWKEIVLPELKESE